MASQHHLCTRPLERHLGVFLYWTSLQDGLSRAPSPPENRSTRSSSHELSAPSRSSLHGTFPLFGSATDWQRLPIAIPELPLLHRRPKTAPHSVPLQHTGHFLPDHQPPEGVWRVAVTFFPTRTFRAGPRCELDPKVVLTSLGPSAVGTLPSRRQNLRFQEQRGNSVSTFTLSRPPLTHSFRSCLPTWDSTPTVFRPCRFSRLRRFTPRTAFRHFSAGNASGVTTLQSIHPYPRSRTAIHAAVFPLRVRTPFFRMDDADSPLFHMSEIGTRSKRGLSTASSLEVVSASQCVSDGWGAQLSWASSGGHLTKARLPASAGATPASRHPRSPVVSERLFPSGLFSLRRPPDQLGFRSWALPSHQDESWCFAATAPTSHAPHGTRSNRSVLRSLLSPTSALPEGRAPSPLSRRCSPGPKTRADVAAQSAALQRLYLREARWLSATVPLGISRL